MIGETVTVQRPVQTGKGPGNTPIIRWDDEDVDDVLVSPGPRADVIDSNRPAGVQVQWTLHFPRGYPATLRGARIIVRGGEPAPVIGDPQHFTLPNTPGRWSMPVEVARTDG